MHTRKLLLLPITTDVSNNVFCHDLTVLKVSFYHYKRQRWRMRYNMWIYIINCYDNIKFWQKQLPITFLILYGNVSFKRALKYLLAQIVASSDRLSLRWAIHKALHSAMNLLVNLQAIGNSMCCNLDSRVWAISHGSHILTNIILSIILEYLSISLEICASLCYGWNLVNLTLFKTLKINLTHNVYDQTHFWS